MIEVINVSKKFNIFRQNNKKNICNLFLKKFEKIDALSNINLKINTGEMVGYIGPNGAGKSTTIKILSGILTPDSGEVNVDGIIPWKKRKQYVRNIGVVFGQRTQLWWDLPVIESFELLKTIYRISEMEYKKTLHQLIEMLKLGSILKIPTRQLSLGQRMKCEIAASLIHNPKILFLDEPTIGLDAVSKKAVRKFIKDINIEKNITLLLTTHDMQDIESLTNRIILIGNGKILYDGEKKELKGKYQEKIVHIKCKGNIPELLEGMSVISKEGKSFLLKIQPQKLTTQLAIKYLIKKIEILDVSILETPVDDIIIKMYKEYKL